MSLAVLSLGSTVAVVQAESRPMDGHRMTVVRVDLEHGRMLCAEHQRWVRVAKADLQHVLPGDVVRVDRVAGQLPRLVLLRTAADEIASPE
jgi:hypothetical protein